MKIAQTMSGAHEPKNCKTIQAQCAGEQCSWAGGVPDPAHMTGLGHLAPAALDTLQAAIPAVPAAAL